MPDRILDLRLFRYAQAAAEHGSFRRAAVALNVLQSSVSKGVRSLEYRVGAPLFERSHSGVRPTPAGERFLQEVTQGFDHLDRAMQRIGAVQRGEHGELTVAVSVPFRLLEDVLEPFRDRHQGVSVEMVEGTCGSSLTLILQRKADIAFVTKTPADGVSQFLFLRNERLKVALPKSHRLAQARVLMLEELRSEKFIFSASGMGPEVGDYLVRRVAKSGVEPDLHLHRVGFCDLLSMVACGFGVTIVVGQLPRAAPEEVVLIPLAGRSAIGIHAVWMESNSNPALSSLLRILRASTSPSQPT
ncbi:LysR family transcriptional regulator [Mesorhizobium australicum]|uniref:Transcriptional regulator, LysR family n=1 Tax=Mesorhizobium australicum TaxID=536018 RepID=A0A1X7MXF4_9HYPH|nr:LysR family transcriptional regulator [Mesorhizobium australicum]SMH29559.1 transcriptional regulator, LysR family [Mesorhizobium australicum]